MKTYNQCMIDEYYYDPESSKIIAGDTLVTDAFKSSCKKNDLFALYDEANRACGCMINYQSLNGKCVSNNTIVCYRNSGENAEMKSDGNCGCKIGYYMNENDKCIFGTKPKIDLTQDIKTYIDNGNDCFRGRTFTQNELQACNDYKTKPRYYDVNIVTTLNKAIANTMKADDISGDRNVFNRNLKIGMSGDDVKQLQVFLQKLKYLPLSHVPSIYFGPITNKALIKFQKDNKIYPASGYFATSSQSKLIELIK